MHNLVFLLLYILVVFCATASNTTSGNPGATTAPSNRPECGFSLGSFLTNVNNVPSPGNDVCSTAMAEGKDWCSCLKWPEAYFFVDAFSKGQIKDSVSNCFPHQLNSYTLSNILTECNPSLTQCNEIQDKSPQKTNGEFVKKVCEARYDCKYDDITQLCSNDVQCKDFDSVIAKSTSSDWDDGLDASWVKTCKVLHAVLDMYHNPQPNIHQEILKERQAHFDVCTQNFDFDVISSTILGMKQMFQDANYSALNQTDQMVHNLVVDNDNGFPQFNKDGLKTDGLPIKLKDICCETCRYASHNVPYTFNKKVKNNYFDDSCDNNNDCGSGYYCANCHSNACKEETKKWREIRDRKPDDPLYHTGTPQNQFWGCGICQLTYDKKIVYENRIGEDVKVTLGESQCVPMKHCKTVDDRAKERQTKNPFDVVNEYNDTGICDNRGEKLCTAPVMYRSQNSNTDCDKTFGVLSEERKVNEYNNVKLLTKHACKCYTYMEKNMAQIVENTDLKQLDCYYDVHVDHTFEEKARFCNYNATINPKNCDKKKSKDTCLSSGCVWRDRLINGKCFRDPCKVSKKDYPAVLGCDEKCEKCEANSIGKPSCHFKLEMIDETCRCESHEEKAGLCTIVKTTTDDRCRREAGTQRSNCTGISIKSIVEKPIVTKEKGDDYKGTDAKPRVGPCDEKHTRWFCGQYPTENIVTLRGSYYRTPEDCEKKKELAIEQQVRFTMDGNCSNVILESSVQYFKGTCNKVTGIANRELCTRDEYLAFVRANSETYIEPGSSMAISTLICLILCVFLL